jgi:hypothetical protein
MKTHYPMLKLQQNNKISINNFTTNVPDYNNKKSNKSGTTKGEDVTIYKKTSLNKNFNDNNSFGNNHIINSKSTNIKHRYNKSALLFNNIEDNNIHKKLLSDKEENVTKINKNKMKALRILVHNGLLDYTSKLNIVFLCKYTKKFIKNKKQLLNITKINIKTSKVKIKDTINCKVSSFPTKTAILQLNFISKENENIIYDNLKNNCNEYYNQFHEILKRLLKTKQLSETINISKYYN